MLSRLRSIVVLTSAALALGACADGTTPPAAPDTSVAPSLNRAAPQRSVARFEVDYMKSTIDHHTAGVVMAQLCIDRAVHAELRQLCEQSLASQRMQIEMLQDWLQDWYGITYEGTIPPSAAQDIRRLSQLSGAEFEDEFLTEFSKHHLGIIKESDKAVERVYHPELRELARSIVIAQSRGVIMMQTWDCEWYDDCRQGFKQQAQRYLRQYT